MSGQIKALALQPVARAMRPRLRALGIDAEALADPGRPVSLRVADRLWSAAGEREALAVAAATEPRTYGHLTFLIGACPTVGEALRCLVAYYGLLSNGAAFSIDPARSAACLTFELRDRAARPDTSEIFMIATVIEFLRRYATDGQPREIELSQASPGLREAARLSAHLGASLTFGHPRASVRWGLRQLGAAMRNAEPQLAAVLEAHARASIAGPPSTTTAQVQAYLEANPQGGSVAAAEVAGGLGVSSRTLRRQLQAEGTSLRVLADAARRRAVEALLARPDVTMAEAADAVGYADHVSFRRAVRRWFGMGPAAYRGTVLSSQISAAVDSPGSSATSTHDS